MLQDVVVATAAQEELKQSGKFKKILQLILLMGNYMNAGSRNAQSIGFDISFITKVHFSNGIALKSHSVLNAL